MKLFDGAFTEAANIFGSRGQNIGDASHHGASLSVHTIEVMTLDTLMGLPFDQP